MFCATNYNKERGVIDAIPIIIYHNIDDTGCDYSTNVNLFESETRYLHDNGFTVLNMADLDYDENTDYLYIKKENTIQYGNESLISSTSSYY